jgi:hypothetical protein
MSSRQMFLNAGGLDKTTATLESQFRLRPVRVAAGLLDPEY